MLERSRLVSRVVVMALVASLSSAVAGTASGAPRARPDRTWMADGRVYSLVRAGDLLLIGGDFTKLLPPRGSGKKPLTVANLAALDLSSGNPVRSWRPRVPGDGASVHALAVSGGVVYVGGRFDRLAGTDVENLGAVQLSDGAAIAGFAPAIGGRVLTLLASPDRLYAGGAFGKVDGLSRAKLAAWDLPSRGLSDEWRPRAVGGAVRDMTFDASRDSIFIGGAFFEMAQGGSTFPRESVAKVASQSGALRTWEIPVGKVGRPQTAWDLETTPSRLYGGFGRGPNFAAAFKPGGDVGIRYWRERLVGNVQAVELSPNGKRLFLGGHFGLAELQQHKCGRHLRGLISVRPRTGRAFCDWIPQLAPHGGNFDGPWTMLAIGRRLWVGGGFAKIGGIEQRNLARFTI
ncbi:MAG: hypothetical protein ACXWX4_01455 [Actinomycetota bacterium]